MLLSYVYIGICFDEFKKKAKTKEETDCINSLFRIRNKPFFTKTEHCLLKAIDEKIYKRMIVIRRLSIGIGSLFILFILITIIANIIKDI